MIVPDANVLLYAVDESSARNEQARRWLEDHLGGAETIGFGWSVLLAFLRLSTRRQVFEQPLTVEDAFDLIDSWLERPSVAVLEPGPSHHQTMRQLLAPLGTAGNLVSDAHLAALAIEHGATLASSDRDFTRFRGLRWTDPFAE